MTFSIVGHQQSRDFGLEWGVAVASKFLAVGSLVPWARAGAGAIATQALSNTEYGRVGLERLASGKRAGEVVEDLIAADPERGLRQVGVVDRTGHTAIFTGAGCQDWAGGHAGPGFACQGNLLTGPDVVGRMAESFETSTGPLVERLVVALMAGDEAGGDRRGRQSAAVLIVREGGGYQGRSDVAADLRVDDHPDPVVELRRLVSLHRFLFPGAHELRWIPIDDALALEIRARLADLGRDVDPTGAYDDAVRAALYDFLGMENLEERWSEEPKIELKVLEWLREKSWLDDVRR